MLSLIIFDPKKLPEIGRAMGQTLKEFKSSTKGIMEENEDEKKSIELGDNLK